MTQGRISDSWDDLDRQIYLKLRADARLSNVQLARELRVSEKTIRNRVARLIEDEGLQFGVSLPHDTTDSETRYLFMLSTGRGTKRAVARRLADTRPVVAVDVATGFCDVVVQARFTSVLELAEFLEDHLESDPAITAVQQAQLLHRQSASRSHPTAPRIAGEDLVDIGLTDLTFDSMAAGLDWMCTEARRILGADRAMVIWYPPHSSTAGGDADRPRQLTVCSSGLSDGYTERLREHFDATGQLSIIERVAMTREHVVVEDVADSPLIAGGAPMREEGFRSVVGLPLLDDDTVRGVFCLYFDTPTSVGGSDYLTAAQALANRCAGSLAAVAETGART